MYIILFNIYIIQNLFVILNISTTQLTHFPLDKIANTWADIFKLIFLNEKSQIFIQISLKFVPQEQ